MLKENSGFVGWEGVGLANQFRQSILCARDRVEKGAKTAEGEANKQVT